MEDVRGVIATLGYRSLTKMNIFATDPDPRKSAKWLDDKRVIKMVLETAQLLSTAITLRGGKGPYRVTHRNHPCAVWTRETVANYDWLCLHFVALCNEYTSRYGRRHKCADLLSVLKEGRSFMPQGSLTPFSNCTSFKNELDTHCAYKMYLRVKWKTDKRRPTWYKLAIPLPSWWDYVTT